MIPPEHFRQSPQTALSPMQQCQRRLTLMRHVPASSPTPSALLILKPPLTLNLARQRVWSPIGMQSLSVILLSLSERWTSSLALPTPLPALSSSCLSSHSLSDYDNRGGASSRWWFSLAQIVAFHLAFSVVDAVALFQSKTKFVTTQALSARPFEWNKRGVRWRIETQRLAATSNQPFYVLNKTELFSSTLSWHSLSLALLLVSLTTKTVGCFLNFHLKQAEQEK